MDNLDNINKDLDKIRGLLFDNGKLTELGCLTVIAITVAVLEGIRQYGKINY